MKTSFAIIFAISALANARELPKDFETCRRSDPEYKECLGRVVTSFIRSLGSGSKTFNIPPVDPLEIERIKIGNSDSPVALKQEYRNIKLYGLTNNLIVTNYSIDFDNLIIHSQCINPRVDFVADYQIEGQVLLLPIRGKGRSNITMTNVYSTNTIYCEKYVKNDETYLRVTNYTVNFKPENVILQFDNLFDGDKGLGDQLQVFLNENSRGIFSELQGPYEESFGVVFKGIANRVLRYCPFGHCFPE